MSKNGVSIRDPLARLNAWMDLYEAGGKINNDDFCDLYKDLVRIRDVLVSEIEANKYEDYVYAIIKFDCEGMDSIYGDYIERIVGTSGLNALIKNDMVESCGVVNGRQLYVLK